MEGITDRHIKRWKLLCGYTEVDEDTYDVALDRLHEAHHALGALIADLESDSPPPPGFIIRKLVAALLSADRRERMYTDALYRLAKEGCAFIDDDRSDQVSAARQTVLDAITELRSLAKMLKSEAKETAHLHNEAVVDSIPPPLRHWVCDELRAIARPVKRKF